MRLFPIGDICALQNGRAFKPTEWSEKGTPIIRIQNLTDESKPFNYCNFEVDSKYHVRNGDLLFSWSGTPGTSFGAFFWRRELGYLNQHIFRVDPYNPKDLSLEYFRLVLNSKLDEIIGQAHGGVGLQHITKEKLNKIEVYLPEYNDQIRIADLLGKVEGLIAQRKRHLQQLDDLLKSVFLEMFGDPVRNEKGWPIEDLDSFIDQSRGISYGIVQRGENCSGGVPILRIRDVIAEEYIEENLVRTDPINSEKYARTVLQGGELLLSIRGTVGAISVAPPHAIGWNVSRELAVIPVSHGVNKKYLVHLLKSPPMQRQFSSMIKGVAQSGLNLSDIRRIGVILPPAGLQSSYEKIATKIESLIHVYRKNLWNLEALYGAMSQQAFKGELDLSRVPLPEDTVNQAAKVEELAVIDNNEASVLENFRDYPLSDPKTRRRLIERAFGSFLMLTKEGREISMKDFWAGLAWDGVDLVQEGDLPFKAKDYDLVKKLVFDAIARGEIVQTRNQIEVGEKVEFGNEVILKKAL